MRASRHVYIGASFLVTDLATIAPDVHVVTIETEDGPQPVDQALVFFHDDEAHVFAMSQRGIDALKAKLQQDIVVADAAALRDLPAHG